MSEIPAPKQELYRDAATAMSGLHDVAHGMTKPDDIPQDMLAIGTAIALDLPYRVGPRSREFAAMVIARAVLAERERAIAACEAQKVAFLSTGYAANQPIGSLLERFACDECIAAIRGDA